jgi:hypothetical protein
MMNCKGHGRKKSCPILRYYPIIYLMGLSKIMKNPSQNKGKAPEKPSERRKTKEDRERGNPDTRGALVGG